MNSLRCFRFSAEGTPLTMDSEGIVRMVNTGLASTWTHVANTRQQVVHSECQLLLSVISGYGDVILHVNDNVCCVYACCIHIDGDCDVGVVVMLAVSTLMVIVMLVVLWLCSLYRH